MRVPLFHLLLLFYLPIMFIIIILKIRQTACITKITLHHFHPPPFPAGCTRWSA